jgi:hypothetical protein
LEAIYEIVSGRSEDLTEIKATLSEYSSTSAAIGATPAEHTSTLAEHGVKLDQFSSAD